MKEDKVGIILMDMWDSYAPLYSYYSDLIEHYTLNVGLMLDAILDMPVALCCHVVPEPGGPHPILKWRFKENLIQKIPNRIMSNSYDNVLKFFKEREVTTLCYAGESLPGCIEDRKLGLFQLRKAFKIKIIADCTLDLFNAHKHDYDRINEMYRYMQKRNYEYTFSADIIENYRKQNA